MRKAKAVERKVILLLGPAAFYVGLLIVLGAAFIEPSGWLYVGLGVLGVIVGVLNITAREAGPFLLAAVAFIVGALAMAIMLGYTIPMALVAKPAIIRLAANLVVLIGAAAMVVSLRAIYEAAKGR